MKSQTPKYLVAQVKPESEHAMRPEFEYVTHGGWGSTNDSKEAQRFTMARAEKWLADSVLDSDLGNWAIIPL